MTQPVSGPSPSLRPSAPVLAPGGAGEAGVEAGLPQPLEITPAQLRSALNPLHHLPVVGMFYRLATGETIPAPLRVLGAGLTGGPMSALGAAFMCLVEEIVRMGPDTSRPAAPAGMAAAGSEAGVGTVSPGTLADGAYLTLATTQPDFLQPATQLAGPDAARGAAAYQQAALEWRRAEWLEKGTG